MPQSREQAGKGALNDKQRLFCREYLVDHNATSAAIRAGYSKRTAQQYGFQLLNKTSVRAELERLENERAERLEISGDDVLRRWWQLANADARELIGYQHDACRYCYGKKHHFQWINRIEFDQACASAAAEDQPLPDDSGGYGYHPDRLPDARCPQCFGRGLQTVAINDTRHLSGSAQLLYAGVRQTQNGIEVKMEDRSQALLQVARHLGMFKVPLEADVSEEGTLGQILGQLMGNTLRPQRDSED